MIGASLVLSSLLAGGAFASSGQTAPAATLESLLKLENRDKLVAVLAFHVVPGRVMAADAVKLPDATTLNGQRFDIVACDGKVFVGEAEVVRTDILCSNGAIHVIDAAILPEPNPIPAVAAEAGNFTMLLAAVEAAGIAPVLLGKGPFTVMAPTNAAFAKLEAGTVESLLKPENRAKLVEILTYHVIPGRVYSDAVVKLTEAPSLLGRMIPISVKDGVVSAGGARVVVADIPASNGVIHVIDTVMMPPPAVAGSKPATPATPSTPARRSY